MAFSKRNVDGDIVRNRVAIMFDPDEQITEQHHKDEVNINNIIKRHGLDMIAKTASVIQMQFDENPNNDFTEVMTMMVKAKDSFESLPSKIRKEFDNDPAKFVDFVRNPDNAEQMYDLGLAERPQEPKPIEVVVTNPPPAEAPPAEAPPE